MSISAVNHAVSLSAVVSMEPTKAAFSMMSRMDSCADCVGQICASEHCPVSGHVPYELFALLAQVVPQGVKPERTTG